MSMHPPYGKRRAPDRIVIEEGEERSQRRWEDHPEEMPIVEEIVGMEIAGMNYFQIAAELNARGIRSRGARWSRNTVMRICKRAAGDVAYAKA